MAVNNLKFKIIIKNDIFLTYNSDDEIICEIENKIAVIYIEFNRI